MIAPRFILILATASCFGIVLGSESARAAVYVVDGACPVSGTGSTLVCGPDGPFRTASEGIEAMGPGDTLNIRGAHDGFDGVYFEQLSVSDDSLLPGKALGCSLTQRCVIQGCRAPVCPTDEQPVIRGMTLRSDWVSEGGGVYRRIMEATPEPDGLERDLFDPHLLMQGTATPLTMLAYAGDDVTTPADGEWSYHPATQIIFANPLGDADPVTEIFVPHYAFNVHIQDPSAYLTLQYLTFEGSRGRSIDAHAEPPTTISGLVLRHLIQRYVPRHFILTNGARGLSIEDNLTEYGCRGMSWSEPQGDGCFGYRVFGATNSVIRRNVIRHLGAAGRRKLSGGINGWPCSWCDPPWDDGEHTDVSASGVCINVKQTEGSTVEDNHCEDVSLGGIFLDVSRRVTVARNTLWRTRMAIGLSDFTPTNGCPTTATSEFCYNSDLVIRDNLIDESGLANIGACAVSIDGGSERHDGAAFLAQVYNNLIAHPGFAGICLKSALGTPTSDVSVWHNTVYGARNVAGAEPSRGIVVRDATSNVSVRNNALDGLTSDALVLTTTAAGGLSLDGDVVGTAGCQVLWNVPDFTQTPSGGTCDTLATFAAANAPHEANGRTGALQFADVAAVPPDLHLTAGSVAIDAGVSVDVDRDIDGEHRPFGASWDAGADEYYDEGTVTTTTTPGGTTTTSTTVPLPQTYPLSATKLLLKTAPSNPKSIHFLLESRDEERLTLGDVAGIPALVTQEGSLKIAAVGELGFVKVYNLPSRYWRLIDAKHPEKGVRYASRSTPIRKVRLEVGRRLIMKGSGGGLEPSLEQEPTEMQVELRIAGRVYCMDFGGAEKQFKEKRKLLRTMASRPGLCPLI
jgi:hypothetical protein